MTFGTLASQYLNAGDKILEIEKLRADSLFQSEVNRLIENDQVSLHLLVEKLPDGKRPIVNHTNGNVAVEPTVRHNSYDSLTEQECIKENNGVKHSTKIWLRETNSNTSLGKYDLQVDFQRTKYNEEGGFDKPTGIEFSKRESMTSRNHDRMKVMSENFDKIFRHKIGDWLEANMLGVDESRR